MTATISLSDEMVDSQVLFSPKQLDSFFKAASSLKLFSRAELNDDKNRSLIEKLYVDPLPNEQAFKTLLGNSTTVIVGRKGTGKSTVFQRAQHEIRKNKSNIISAYMDIRNVYESSQVDPIAAERLEKIATAMSPSEVQKFSLYKRFFYTLVSDIRTELKTQVERSYLSRLKDRFFGTSAEIFAGLDRILGKIDKPNYENIDGFITIQEKESDSTKVSGRLSTSTEIAASPHRISESLKAEVEAKAQKDAGSEQEYARLLMRVL